MTDIAPEPRSAGSHRRNDRGRLRLLLLSLLVVVIASGAVVATLHWRGEDKKLPAVAAKTTHPPAKPSTSTSVPAPTGSPAPSSVPAPSSPATVSSPALPSATAGTPLSSAPAEPSSSASQSAAAHLPLDVLNSTHTSGLAASAARTLRSGGWTVVETGNYPHTMIGTTVYYPAGQLASAQLLATEFPAISRVEAAPSGVSTTNLTVVLAKDWTASGK